MVLDLNSLQPDTNIGTILGLIAFLGTLPFAIIGLLGAQYLKKRDPKRSNRYFRYAKGLLIATLVLLLLGTYIDTVYSS